MKKLYILCGVAFSGKSTLAKKIAEYKKAVLVSQDEFWFAKKRSGNWIRTVMKIGKEFCKYQEMK